MTPERRKEILHKYNRSAKARACRRRYRKGLKGKAAEKRYVAGVRGAASRAEITQAFLARRRGLSDRLKAKPCADCGRMYPPYVMDFDHCRGEKVFAVSTGLKHSVATILAEVAKCEVVCANCHRERTAQRNVRALDIGAPVC